MKCILLASALLIVLSCRKNVKQNKGSFNNSLSGQWITKEYLNDGKYNLLYLLKFENNNDFDWKITSYEGTDSSFSYLYSGTFLADKNTIKFQAKKQQTWDSSNSGGLQVKEINQSLFDSCRYEIRGDSLRLNYYTYPGDGPVLTRSIYTRVK